MRRRLAKTLAIALLIAAAGSAGSNSFGESFRLTGDSEAVWLIIEPAGGYRLAVKPMNRPWQSLGELRTGRISAATAVGDSLTVFFAGGGHVRWFVHQVHERPGINPPGRLWPTGTRAMAACPTGGAGSDAILVLVANATRGFAATEPAASWPATGTTLPASRPATDARSPLALLRYAEEEWSRVALIDPEFVRQPSGGHLAVHEGVVYVLLEQEPATLIALEQGAWRRVDLPKDAVGDEPLALVAMPEALVLVTFDDAGQVKFARREGGKWTPTEIVRRGEEPAVWQGEAMPAVARLGSRLALLWRRDATWFYGTCGFDGKLSEGLVRIFHEGMAKKEAFEILRLFFWGVLALTVVLMFWPGQALRTAPFSLPETMFPAQLSKRIAAFTIDVLPFTLFAGAFAVDLEAEVSFQGFLKGDVPVRLLYAYMAFLIAYPAYCILMEHRFGGTLGKLLLHLRVVGAGGRRPRLREVALRNVSKIPEMMAFVAVIPVLFPILTRYRQRLGDKIAWTTVIDVDLSLPPPVGGGPSEPTEHHGDSNEQDKP